MRKRKVNRALYGNRTKTVVLMIVLLFVALILAVLELFWRVKVLESDLSTWLRYLLIR